MEKKTTLQRRISVSLMCLRPAIVLIDIFEIVVPKMSISTVEPCMEM